MDNVDLVLADGYRIIQRSLPASVRAELMQGVKNGRLGRKPKKEHLKEVFYALDKEAEALKARELEYLECLRALAKVCC